MENSEYPKQLRYVQNSFSIKVTERAMSLAADVLDSLGYKTKIDVDRQQETPILVIDLEKTFEG